MKSKFLLLFILLLTTCLCEDEPCFDDGNCKESSLPRCNTEKEICVKCVEPSDCSLDQYCDTSENLCVDYSDDEKLGSFCNSHFCSEQEEKVVCGKCEDDNNIIWEGQCVNFKCEQCNTKYPDLGLVSQHPNSICAPKGVSGYAGKLIKYQNNGDGSLGYIYQDVYSLTFLFYGMMAFAYVIAQIFLLTKL
ncbi:hypothetical protein M0813_07202 [Anaeramoeba flamelloides]|uniref:Uncharacterized protein n=1 Tax=Anaeramoeba flamelloides TaxID=1746091 RepID=A0AAV7Y9R0_9EUKA|nr:hypothetical protein M0812_26107 [Anaeramoeba flamelloides]KAJ6229981.1 hypothetical protein M0813_07202 [Anaeramoeba flamelloides]